MMRVFACFICLCAVYIHVWCDALDYLSYTSREVLLDFISSSSSRRMSSYQYRSSNNISDETKLTRNTSQYVTLDTTVNSFNGSRRSSLVASHAPNKTDNITSRGDLFTAQTTYSSPQQPLNLLQNQTVDSREEQQLRVRETAVKLNM